MAARGCDLPSLHAFTPGLDLDAQAVNPAVTLPFHNGRTEGVNTKTKMIKRQMYGRAGFTLSCATAACWASTNRHHRRCDRAKIRQAPGKAMAVGNDVPSSPFASCVSGAARAAWFTGRLRHQ